MSMIVDCIDGQSENVFFSLTRLKGLFIFCVRFSACLLLYKLILLISRAFVGYHSIMWRVPEFLCLSRLSGICKWFKPLSLLTLSDVKGVFVSDVRM